MALFIEIALVKISLELGTFSLELKLDPSRKKPQMYYSLYLKIWIVFPLRL